MGEIKYKKRKSQKYWKQLENRVVSPEERKKSEVGI